MRRVSTRFACIPRFLLLPRAHRVRLAWGTMFEVLFVFSFGCVCIVRCRAPGHPAQAMYAPVAPVCCRRMSMAARALPSTVHWGLLCACQPRLGSMRTPLPAACSTMPRSASLGGTVREGLRGTAPRVASVPPPACRPPRAQAPAQRVTSVPQAPRCARS